MPIVLKGAGCDCEDCDEADPCNCVPAAPVQVSDGSFTACRYVPFSYDASVHFTGTVESYHSAFALPDGLSLNSATGEISGTPTAHPATGLSILIYASNCCGNSDFADITVTIKGIFCGLSATGGDEGYDETFFYDAFDVQEAAVFGSGFNYDYDMVTIKDQLIISLNGSTCVDTGCVAGSGSGNFNSCSAPPGNQLRVQIIPNCEATTGTIWSFNLTC